MKDYWRPRSKKIYTELAAYERLQEKKVRHVATAIAGGDVGDQKTVTDEYMEEKMRPLEHVHCRLVLKELARPLSDYNYSSEMIVLIYHALEGKGHNLVSVYQEITVCPQVTRMLGRGPSFSIAISAPKIL
jgi:hypothetical protein